MSHIEGLATRIEQQEDSIQKQEAIIAKLVEYVNAQEKLRVAQSHYPTAPRPMTNPRPTRAKTDAAKNTHPQVKLFMHTMAQTGTTHTQPQPSQVQIVEEEDEPEEDLDAEIRSELGELLESEET